MNHEVSFALTIPKTSSNNKLLSVPVIISSMGFPAIIDSGSSISLIRPDIVRDHHLVPIVESNIKIKLVHNSTIQLNQLVEFEFGLVFMEKIYKHQFYIFDKLTHPIIIGVDFLRKFNIGLKFGKREGIIQDDDSNYNEVLLMDAETTNVITPEEAKCQKQKDAIDALLDKFPDIFGTSVELNNFAVGVEHRIHLKTDIPIRLRPFRTSPEAKRIIEQQIKEMKEKGIIEDSHSPYASPVVLVKKRDLTWRFAIDYRELNKISINDAFPLPLIQDLIDSFTGCTYFSVLDLTQAYWQVKVKNEDVQKTAFITSSGLYEFKRMPFGLSSAPATLQRYLQKVFEKHLFKSLVIYLDDILVFSKSFEEHLNHLEQVFEILSEYNLRLKKSKCNFATNQIKYLGFVISGDGISTDPEKIQAVEGFPRPTNVKGIRSFIGLCSFYRRFVKNFSNIAKPMTELLKKDKRFEWNERCEKAFNELKDALMCEPVLRHFVPGKEIVIYTDSSGFGLGAILCQIEDGKEYVVAYSSKLLTDTQQRYSASERECLAIVFACQKYRAYVFGAHFTIKTDHNALVYLMKVKDPTGRLARMAILLQDFDFTICYRKGALHQNVDALSRNVIEEPDPDLEEFPMLLCEEMDMVGEQSIDEWCSKVKRKLEEGKEKKYTRHFKVVDEILYRISSDREGKELLLLCVPSGKRRDEIMNSLHDIPISGHCGIYKTYIKARERFYWPHLHRSIVNYITHCEECQKFKPDSGKPKGNLQSIPCPDGPMEFCCMDLLGPISPSTSRKHNQIIIFVDLYSKFLILGALKNSKADTIAKWLLNYVIYYFGAIGRLLTDQGKGFCSYFMESFYKLSNCQHIKTTPLHPQGNGQAERTVRTVKDMLCPYFEDHLKDWDQLLPQIAFAYNTSEHSSTKDTPARIFLGWNPRLPVDLKYNLPKHYSFLKKTKEQIEFVQLRTRDAQQSQKESYNSRHSNVVYKVGERVALSIHRKEIGISEKFLPKYDYPFEIVKVLSPVTYKIRRCYPPRIYKVVNIARLKPYHSNKDPKHVQRAEGERTVDDKIESEDSQVEKSGRGVGPVETSPIEEGASSEDSVTDEHSDSPDD